MDYRRARSVRSRIASNQRVDDLSCVALLLSLLIVLIAAFGPQWATAQTAPSEVQRLVHESWTFKDGAPEPSAFAQTADGYLWVGSQAGLFRFDGMRFELFRSPFGDPLLSTNVSALFAADGGLWVGYVFGGFSFLKNGQVRNFHAATGRVINFARDTHGVIWASANTAVTERSLAFRGRFVAGGRSRVGHAGEARRACRVRSRRHPVGSTRTSRPGIRQGSVLLLARRAPIPQGRRRASLPDVGGGCRQARPDHARPEARSGQLHDRNGRSPAFISHPHHSTSASSSIARMPCGRSPRTKAYGDSRPRNHSSAIVKAIAAGRFRDP